MSELTWAKLSLLNVEAIDDAATYWSTYIGQLTEAADAIETDVPKTIDEDSFGEQIGEDCRSQLRAIAGEIHDHIDEAANKIKTLLEDAHEYLSDHKTKMRDLVDEVLDAKLRITEGGEVYLSEARVAEIQSWAQQQADADEGLDADDLVHDEIERVRDSECRPLTGRIRMLVDFAKGYDDDVTTRLNSIRDAYVEMPPPLGSDWHEDVAEYWSNRAVDLLNGGEDGELSAEELDEFIEIVADRADNPVFATTLMNELGPTGLTTHLANVVSDVYVTNDDTFTPDQVDRMYEALGVAIATATDPTNESHVDEAWIAELMNAGGSRVTTGSGWQVNGYEILAPALPHGQYHEDFLVPVTEHMIAIDASQGWSSIPPLTEMASAHPEVDNGYNPVNWALVALDNNPTAALDLFDGGGTGLEDIDGVNLDGVRPVTDPFQYLLDRAEPGGVPADVTISPDLLGNALESATTGVPTNPAYAPDTPPVHTSRMASLADQLIDHVTANPDEFTSGPKSQMLDNFGSITVAYIDDFHQAVGSEGTENWAVDQLGADLSLGSPSEENDRLASDWLRIIGYDQGATAEVWGASEALMYNQLESALAYDDQGIQAGGAFEMHGRVTAALTVGSLDAIVDGVYQAAADRNAVVDLFAEGAKFGAGVGTGVATGNPLAGAAADQLSGYVIDIIVDPFRISAEEAEAEIAEVSQERIELNEETMRSQETLRHIEDVLRANSNLSEENIRSYLHDYYESYWDLVKLYYAGRPG